MTADRLREAARVLRERAEAATPGPWQVVPIGDRADVRGLPENTSHDYRGDSIATAADSEFGACYTSDATFIALMSPPVALAVADWLSAAEEHLGSYDCEAHCEPDGCGPSRRALATADAILGDRR